MTAPELRKARRLQGRTLAMRDAQEADAGFILALRTDERLSRHLQPTPPALAEQATWLKRYAQRRNEAYFVIENAGGEALGTVRLLDPRGDSFSWGSWILKPGAPSGAAIESALMVYAYALDVLGFRHCHFQVRRDNARVCAFHERFGAVCVARGDLDLRYSLSHDAIRAAMKRFVRFLPEPLTVEV